METGFITLGVLLGSLAERFKRGLQALQPATHRLSGSANPDAEVFRSLEEFSWHHAGVERVAQGSHELGGAASPESRKHGCAETAQSAIELRMSG